MRAGFPTSSYLAVNVLLRADAFRSARSCNARNDAPVEVMNENSVEPAGCGEQHGRTPLAPRHISLLREDPPRQIRSSCRLLIVQGFCVSSRFESVMLSHHPR